MRGLFIGGDLVGFCGSVYDASHESKHTSWLHSHLIKFLTISKSVFFNLALLTSVIFFFLIELKNRLLRYFLRCVSSNLHSRLLDAEQQSSMVVHVLIMVVAELVHNIRYLL